MSLSNERISYGRIIDESKEIDDAWEEGEDVWGYNEDDLKKAIQELKESIGTKLKPNIHNTIFVNFFFEEIDKIFGKPLVEDTTSGKELVE